MRIGFFTVFRTDPQHFLHASALVRDCQMVMPNVPTVQLTDQRTGIVPGVTDVRRAEHGPMLQRRLEHYATCDGAWLLVDTDVSVRADVRAVFDDPIFDVALCDRHAPESIALLQAMPFNTGVVFSRSSAFWGDVLNTWLDFSTEQRDWLSEQRAVYAVVRSGRYRVKILPGTIYNYAPQHAEDAPKEAAILHYKGHDRKRWLSTRCYQVLGQPMRAELASCA